MRPAILSTASSVKKPMKTMFIRSRKFSSPSLILSFSIAKNRVFAMMATFTNLSNLRRRRKTGDMLNNNEC